MTVEGVMVSYNYSEDEEHANILTVSSSGLKFSKRWVLTHGSILSPLKNAQIVQYLKRKPILNENFYDNLPEIHVTCEKKKKGKTNVCDEVEKLSRERFPDSDYLSHSSYQIRVLTGRICHIWQCPILERCVEEVLYSWTVGHQEGGVEAQSQLGKSLLSVFVLIDLDYDRECFRICHIWQCPILERCVEEVLYSWTVGHQEGGVEAQSQLGKSLLSVFVLIDLDYDRGPKSLRPLSELFDMVRPAPQRGSNIEVTSTPFGCEVFLNAVTRGSICGVVGKKPSLLLTDASTALGSEGGPVFTEGPTKELVGVVVCSVAWWRGEWVGLTLVAPLLSVLAAKLRVAPPSPAKIISSPHSDILDRIDSMTVLVRCGGAWGAGVFLGDGYVITCAHVVTNYSIYKVSVYCKGVKETAIVRYKTTDDKAYDLAVLYMNPHNWTHLQPAVLANDPAVVVYCKGVKETAIVRYKTTDDKAYDLAILYMNPHNWTHLQPAVLANEPAVIGESVLASGFPYFSERELESPRPLVTSGHLNSVSPSLLQTSCCVQSGFSGGPIIRVTKTRAVEVLGVIVCSAKTQSGACYPNINMAVPVTVFAQAITTFLENKDVSKLSSMENNLDMIQSQWRLMPYRSKI